MTFPHYLAIAPAEEFFWWTAVPIALAAAAFVATFVFVHRKRLMEDMPTARLRSAAQGYVELEGIVRLMDGPPIHCPLTATRCVWWRYKVERRETDTDADGKTRTSWVTVDAEVSDECFLLDDGTGTCVVDPSGAQVVPTVCRRWYGGTRRPTIGPEAGKGIWRALYSDYRYTEELIFPANAVYALGAYRTQYGAPEAFDEQADLRELLGKWKHDKAMMTMLDVNKDGAVDQREWEAARRVALRKVRDTHIDKAVATPDLHILARPRDGRPFILSGIPQAALIRRYRAYAAACIAGTTMASSFALWALHLRGIVG